ncbi:Cyclopropane-fatty-acyl-phospholipid synthase [Marinobacterium lacunae]|uniref:Cyclopropane-fatty-acyl-phospholipid synthase n=1 Tax=Marinobacterium lacunae TaxID=1232683 RepID=A0A081FZQ3_9GAMM|nr:cyclopropane-fatty-acyl-phospholipid synthase family protein [Marinobacterium lacunae]KEA64008.1 Cyclopropane-fatty-acyl-phospholipid synthase [Marinobacterium lacunae]
MKPSEYPAATLSATATSEGWLNRRWISFLNRMMPKLTYGRLDLQLPSGSWISCGQLREGAPHAQIRLNSYRPLRRLLRGGLIGWAEGFMEGEWDCPDIHDLALWAVGNESGLQAFMHGHPWLRLVNRLTHLCNNNSRRGSRRNIAYHYDLGNDFYRLWLDPSMTYSAALFKGDEPLFDAQQHKYRSIARKLGLKPGDSVLEVGCGWGGFAELAAREFGVQVHGITLSSEQLDWARERISAAGLDEQCRFSLTDYRDVEEQYDHIVSIEMFEAVGEKHWGSYFAMLRRCLKPGGEALLQLISIDDRRFEHYRRNPDFIQRYIFPGGMLPSPAALKAQLDSSHFELLDEQRFGLDYARTLVHWRESFCREWDKITALGFDERFRRMWLYYLGYCEAGFRTRRVDVGFYHLKPKPVLATDIEGAAQ